MTPNEKEPKRRALRLVRTILLSLRGSMTQLSLFKKQNETDAKKGVCAFTGHRELGEDFSARTLKAEIVELVKRGVTTFLSGMAMGFDLIAAELVLELKGTFPDVKLIACVPCRDQDKSFPFEDKERYAAILAKADEVAVLSEHYYRGCMHARNRYMVDRAEFLLAYCHSETGGTAYTVNYFLKTHDEEKLIDARKKKYRKKKAKAVNSSK